MKIKLSGSDVFNSISSHIELEGDEVVERGEDLSFGNGRERASIGGGLGISNQQALEALGFEVGDNPVLSASQWYDEVWTGQVFVGAEMRGMMDGGLGRDLSTGFVGRFYSKSKRLNDLFHTTSLINLLSELNYRGPVTLSLSPDGKVSRLSYNPGLGLFNLLECRRSKISEVLTDPHANRLYESWTVSLLISRYPYPEIIPIKSSASRVDRELLRNFWPYEARIFRDNITFSSSLLGVVTSAGESVRKAAARALEIAGSLRVEEKQHRLDPVRVGDEMWRIALDIL